MLLVNHSGIKLEIKARDGRENPKYVDIEQHTAKYTKLNEN